MARPGRLWLLAVLALLLALLAVPTAWTSQAEEPETLRLEINGETGSFTYSGALGEPQPIGPADRCELVVDGPLVVLTGNNKGPGLNSNGIGVKSKGAQGTPCGRVGADDGEILTVSLVGVPAAVSAELDLELKGEAEIEITIGTETFTVRAGSSIVEGEGVDGTMVEPYSVEISADDPIGNCRNDSNAGPDSGPRDNCRVIITPASPFRELTFTPMAGEMSLEGGGDFGDVPEADTIFTLTPYDGEIGCDDGNNTAAEVDGAIEATIIRRGNTDGSPCVLKPYTLVVSADDPSEGGEESVIFEIDDPGAQAAIYEANLVFDEPLTTPLSAMLQYDSDRTNGYEDFKDAPACVEDPFDLTDDPAGSLNDEAIPAGHEACVVSVAQTWDGRTTWHAIFAGDWKFR